MLKGQMQTTALTTSMLIDHAAVNHGNAEIISRAASGAITRTNWGELAIEARRIAAALDKSEIAPGNRIATLAWNRTPHLALYYGVTAAGRILHTVNPRLFGEQIEYIINHGGATLLFVDPDLLSAVEPLAGSLNSITKIIVLCERSELPETTLNGLITYDEFIHEVDPIESWPEVDESQGSTLCYTSGTTGNPKGVLYSHRSTVLHGTAILSGDAMALSVHDSILLLTPLFHVNAWGVPFATAMCGAKLVLPGAALDGASVHELVRDEKITFSLGVPTVWMGFLDHIEKHTSSDEQAALCLNRVFVGGAAAPRQMIKRFSEMLGVQVLQAWGMTETSPVATVCQLLPHHQNLDDEARFDILASQGRPLCGVELRVEDSKGNAIPRGTKTPGKLKVRGPWVISDYFGAEPNSAIDDNGWFDTGDVAWVDAEGYLHITDREKDVIKSGGEWISSIEIENWAVSHPAVVEAAVIPAAHPRWQERPLLLVKLQPDAQISKDEMLDHLKPHMAAWWLPDDVVIVEELPHTATGKLLKMKIREEFGDHYLRDKS